MLMMKNFGSYQTQYPNYAVLLVCLLAAALASAQPRPWMPPTGVTLLAKGTGRTTGHIANLSIINRSSVPLQFDVPPMTVPSDGTYQGYIVPDPTPVTVPGNGATTAPVTGYCTHPDLPAPSPGAIMPTPIFLPDDDPLLTVIRQIRTVIPTLQDVGRITTSFSGNPEQERLAILQQFTWYYSIPGGTYDPCWRISQFISDQYRDTDWYSSGSPNIEQGIGQLADALLQVGRMSGQPDFSQPTPSIAGPMSAQPPSNPTVANTVRVTGAGLTTGRIANISVSNPTQTPAVVRIGGGGLTYIPSFGQSQPYVVPSLPDILVPPGATVTVPVEGFCVDVRRPPVGLGDAMPPIQDWISGGLPTPERMNPISGTLVSIPTQTTPPLSTVVGILQNLPPPLVLSKWDCPDLPQTNRALLPGTDRPINTPINTDLAPALGVPLLLDAIGRITRAYDVLKPKGSIATPFSGNPDKERESVIQQTFWIYSAALRGEPYQKDDFRDNTIKQFEQNTGRSFAQVPQPQQEQIERGVDDFWNSFQATGVEAKILPKVPMEPRPEPKLDDLWNSFYDGGGKPKGTTTAPTLTDPRQTTTTPTDPPVLIKDEPGAKDKDKNPECSCGDVSFGITVWRMEATPDPAKRGRITYKGVQPPFKKNVTEPASPSLPPAEIKAGIKGFKQGDRARITINDITMTCPCSNSTACDPYENTAQADAHTKALDDLEKLKKKLGKDLEKAREDLEKAKKALAEDAKKQANLKEAEEEWEQAENDLQKAQAANDRYAKAEEAYKKAQADEKAAKTKEEKAAAKAATAAAKAERDAAQKETVSSTKMKEFERKKTSAKDKIDKINKPVTDAQQKVNALEKQLQDAEKTVAGTVSGKPSIKTADGKADAAGTWDGKAFTFADLDKKTTRQNWNTVSRSLITARALIANLLPAAALSW